MSSSYNRATYPSGHLCNADAATFAGPRGVWAGKLSISKPNSRD